MRVGAAEDQQAVRPPQCIEVRAFLIGWDIWRLRVSHRQAEPDDIRLLLDAILRGGDHQSEIPRMDARIAELDELGPAA
ncbi:MAG TPA: hypothetical protein VKC17_01130 [Sphingomicrobium sp.]|nr:hypothetical protein [Sphingomicrobium sp.]